MSEIKKKKVIKKVLLSNEKRLVQQNIINKNNIFWKEIDNLSFLSKNLYNHAIYILRKNLEDELTKRKIFIENNPNVKCESIKKIGWMDLDKILKADKEYPDYYQLPTKTSQGIIKKIGEVWSSYEKSLFDYFKFPNKYKGRPQPPMFKHKTDGRFIVIYSNQGISSKELKNGFIRLSKSNIKIPFNLEGNITEIRIVPATNKQYKIEVIYIKTVEFKQLNEENKLFIDIGIDNLVTALDNCGNKPFTISGKLIKSVNRKFNDDIARLTSILQLQNKFRKTSNQIELIRNKRNNKIKGILHKISKNVIDYCILHKIKTIVIGKNDGWKQNLSDNMPKLFNQRFTFIPYQMLINQLTYKMDLIGGEVITINESHTSKCDHLVLEPVQHQDKYLGKRNNKKATFTSSNGMILHDDVNGCIGIARKHIKNNEKESIFVNSIESDNFFPKKLSIKL